jgi:Tfp pilus assembly protein FimV
VYAYEVAILKKLGQDIDGEAASDLSGSSVSLSADGKTVAIGASYNDGVNGEDSGHVRVYKINSPVDILQTLIAEQASQLTEQASQLTKAQATISEQASQVTEAQAKLNALAQDHQAIKNDISGQAYTIDEISSESSNFITPLAGGAAALACAGLVLAGLAWRGRSANIKSSDEFAVSSKA